MSRIVPCIARLAARAGGLAVLVMAFVIGIDILARKLFGHTLLSGGAGELSGYALAIVSAWGASLALVNRAHIRIDILQSAVPRPWRIALDLLAIAVFAAAAGVLAWVGCATFLESLRRDAHSMTPLAVPLAVPQALWAAGLVFLFATSIHLAALALLRLAQGRRKEAAALIGARTADDDLQEQQQAIQETAGAEVRHA